MDEDINVAAGYFRHISEYNADRRTEPLCLTGFKQCKLQLRPATIRRVCSAIRLAFAFALFTAGEPAACYSITELTAAQLFRFQRTFPGTPLSPRRKAIINNNEHRSFKGSPIVKYTRRVVGSLCAMNYSHPLVCIFA